MVDREARRKYAELVRQFISGRMTNDEYEQKFFDLRINKKDPAPLEIFSEVRDICQDAFPDKLTQQWRLGTHERRRVSQFVLFLQSDIDYQWSKKLWDGSVFLITAFCVLLLFALLPETPLLIRFSYSAPLIVAWQCYEQWQRKRKRLVNKGDKEAWPFFRQADLAEARRHPRLLNGKRTMP